MAKATTPSYLSVLQYKIMGFSLATILLAIFATIGVTPVVFYLIKLFFASSAMAGAVAILTAAVIVYYLLYAETGNPVLEKHAVAFIALTLGIIIVSYMYLPAFKQMLESGTSNAISQTVTLLVKR